MENTDNDPTYPVAGWQIQTVPAYQNIIIRLDYLTHTSQSPEAPNPGRRYILTVSQAEQLADGIHRQLQNLKNAGFQTPPDHSH